MSYTKEPIIINNPSEKVRVIVRDMKERKHSKLELLRNMMPEDFSCRIFL